MRRPTLHDDALRATGRRHLRKTCAVLSAHVKKHGDPWPGRPRSSFGSLVKAIIDQQISVKAAQTIHARLQARLGGRITPELLLTLDLPEYRAVGVSRQKAAYLLDLAEQVCDRRLVLRRLPHASNDDVIEDLTAVKGIGQWTAEMYLIFVLGRPDVLSVGDLGLQAAAQRSYGLRERPKPAHFERLAQPWKPFRSLASLYLWSSLT